MHVQMHCLRSFGPKGWSMASRVHNGMSAASLQGVVWRKSARSGALGNCVELAHVDGGIAVRNSRFPDGPALVYTREEVAAFVAGAKDGEFDDLLG
ncbi:protein of unknown function DUF397 [Actinosynnema mirum DSM 43827]|uniref:DUF397 domain-containing protein n=2 Tax=Actinosynnema TaxID=40566 RepID=C6WJA2_ACTMD|nr:protein of unknown function DUF397 [Actinosynnema mirum DSM 43827]